MAFEVCYIRKTNLTFDLRDAIKSMPSTEIHKFHHNILDSWDKFKESGRGIYMKKFDPKRPNMKVWDMYYFD